MGFELAKMANEFTRIQARLLPEIDLQNTFSVEGLRKIAGVDLAYWNAGGMEYGICCIVVIDYRTKEVTEKVSSHGRIKVPYIPGYLAFRELPLILSAARKLSVEPDIYMFDGNGYLHQRHMGIATHASIYLRKPSIGVAKSYLKIKNEDFLMPKNIVGSYTDIIIEGEVYGRVLRSMQDVKPIFVSCGNWIDLDRCTDVVMNCVNEDSRLPIPVRLADIETRQVRREMLRNQYLH